MAILMGIGPVKCKLTPPYSLTIYTVTLLLQSVYSGSIELSQSFPYNCKELFNMVGHSINTARLVCPVGDHFDEVPLYM